MEPKLSQVKLLLFCTLQHEKEKSDFFKKSDFLKTLIHLDRGVSGVVLFLVILFQFMKWLSLFKWRS
ncbi:MAG: hypothetical protein DRR08_20225 [Candidatus Parabeggiatoa sp. nov. 2]|nr:MAG: hypothetical protein B6247_20200 [Beggiatoa sp. 4572_84]RKZ56996.1 MAG: hypothetical protein DRR08_20225 [Gammaproteobacteria bacterium]